MSVQDHLRTADGEQARPALGRFLIHLWQRHRGRQLGLILGAGVSMEANCPSWPKLVGGLARAVPGIQRLLKAHRKAGLSDPYLTQIIFNRFREKELPKIKVPSTTAEYYVRSLWLSRVHSELYRDVPDDFADIRSKHKYLEALGAVGHHCPLTVNFNLDDIYDEAVIHYGEHLTPRNLPEITTSLKSIARPNAPVILHINGILPREADRRRSGDLVFSEEAFAEVLTNPNSVEAEQLYSRFASLTMLVIGHSFNDASLKNMLKYAMRRQPANHHYAVLWENDSNPRSIDRRRDISRSI